MIINVNGNIVDNETAAFYNFFDIPCTSPKGIKALLDKNQDDDVTVDIASNGGDVFAASEIYTTLKQYDKPVNVVISGLAASAASVIAMAGDTVKIAPTAQIMIHRASMHVSGNSEALDHGATVLGGVDESIASAYEAKTGLSQDKILSLMDQETWMTAKKAVDLGFADEILFVDDQQPAFVNAQGPMVPKTAVNKLLNLLSTTDGTKDKQHKKTESVQDKISQPSVYDAKLAILLNKKETKK